MLVDCLMQVYRIGFLVTSLPVNCNHFSPFSYALLHIEEMKKVTDPFSPTMPFSALK
mgnify:CR=1 FL=1